MPQRSSSTLFAAVLAAVIVGPISGAQTPVNGGAARLHNGWRLTPAGAYEKVGDTLLGCSLSPDGGLLAMTNAGYGTHHLYLVDVQSGRVKQSFPLNRAWNGLVWSADSATVYVSGGGSPRINVFTRDAGGAFAPAAPILLADLTADPPEEKGGTVDRSKGPAYVSGLALSRDGKTLYAANFTTDTVYAISLPDGAVTARRRLQAGSHPYCLRLTPDGSGLYVTLTPDKRVLVLNAQDLTQTRVISTGGHPNDLLFAPDGRLFVSCGNSDCVLVVNPATGLETERLSMALSPGAPAGATPEALALSPDSRTLYVANADNNDVAVVDIARPGHSRLRGFIPTGWYPSAVCAAPDGKRLFIGSGKGLGTGPSAGAGMAAPGAGHSAPASNKRSYTYIADLLYGTIATVTVPGDARLAAYTRQVMENTPYRDSLIARPLRAPRPGSNPIPSRLGDPSPIKHILYIIKENHTYDQVFGDIKEGNGDPGLVMFGRKITPNMHALARQYALLDNLYCNGEVSGNGHPWSTGAYSTDVGERAWKLDYSNHATWPLKDRDLYPPNGRIWDECERRGLTYASYYFTWTTDNTRRHMPAVWANGYDRRRDFQNADVFISELKRYERADNLPAFMIMSLHEDHTEGTTPGKFTPQAEVASNDLAVGKIVAACSRSRYWKQMAIFVIEDDAQDGPDHVDAHRTEGVVISPYTRRGRVDSSYYNTTSMLRTMELILGLPPMSEYDAAAPPMYSLFMTKPDLTPYSVVPETVNMMERNAQTAYGAKESSQMDFSGPDRLTATQVVALNRILWRTMRGSAPYPAPTRRALLPAAGQGASDGDEDGD